MRRPRNVDVGARARVDVVLGSMVEAGVIEAGGGARRRGAASASQGSRRRDRLSLRGRLDRWSDCRTDRRRARRRPHRRDHHRCRPPAHARRWRSGRGSTIEGKAHGASQARARACSIRTAACRALVGGRSYEQEPVQPRRAGAAPAGLGLQAVRLSRRAGERLHAGHHRARTRRSPSTAGRPRTTPAATAAR